MFSKPFLILVASLFSAYILDLLVFGDLQPQVKVDVSYKMPVDLSKQVTINVKCSARSTADASKGRLMEMTLTQEGNNGQQKTKLASLNALLSETLCYKGENSVVQTEGRLKGQNGILEVNIALRDARLNPQGFSCEAKYIDETFKIHTIQGKETSHPTSDPTLHLYGLMVKQRDFFSKKFSVIQGSLDEVERSMKDLAAAVLENRNNISRLHAIIRPDAKWNTGSNIVPNTTCEALKNVPGLNQREMITWADGKKVLCDTATDGGGWTVFQRRLDGSLDFFRGWEDYVNGFGTPKTDLWLGLKHMRALVESSNQELRVDFVDLGKNYFAKYSNFHIGDVSENYKLKVDGFSGTAANNLEHHSGMMFSTIDKDNTHARENCSKAFYGGWWYNSCHAVNFNGLWGRSEYGIGLNWVDTTSFYRSATFTEMKIRSKK